LIFAPEPPAGLRAAWVFLAVVFAALILAYSLATPLGEAPDEPAHVFYVRTLLQEREIPAIPEQPGELSYEIHQPPLAYLCAAGWLGLAGAERLPILRRDPRFDFEQPPKRYVAEPVAGFHPLRLVNLAWAALLFLGIGLLASATRAPGWLVFGAFSLVLLSPQLLFSFATFSNDAPCIALSTLALAMLLRARTEPRRWLPGGAAAAGLALWMKLSAAFLAVPLALVLLTSKSRARTRVAAVALGSILAAGVAAFQVARGAGLSGLPPGWGLTGGAVRDLWAQPGWLATLWLGFWGKLGWFNVHLPTPAYAWFLIPTGLAGVGAGWSLVRRAGDGLLVLSACAAIAALLGLYLVNVAWQPQGRLLFPAVGGVAWLAALGLEQVAARLPLRPGRVALGLVAGAVAAALTGLAVLLRVF
jgi:hypothetical protein